MEEGTLIKEIYYNQLDNKEKLNSKVSIPIAVETVIVTALSYYYQVIPKLPDKGWVGVYYCLLTILSISFVGSIILNVISYTGFKYKYMTSQIILDTKIAFEQYYDQNYDEYFKDSGMTKEQLISKDFDREITRRFNECNEWNIDQNALKSQRIRLNILLIIISLASALVLKLILIFN